MELDQNASYLFGAYVVCLGGIAVYIASLVLRKLSIDRDEQVIQQIEAEANQEQKAQNAAR
jgi:heme exporter protein D